MIGIIGKGYWGDVYSQTLNGMGIAHWQAGRDWKNKSADRVIIASSPSSHYPIAKQLICAGVPVLIEKPVCFESSRVKKLLKLARYRGVPVFTGHTHLFSPEWKELKKELKKRIKDPKKIVGVSGGPCKLDPLWDWGPHDVSLCIDLMGFPRSVDCVGNYLRLDWGECFANLHFSRIQTQRRFEVDGLVYESKLTKPTPLEILVSEFLSSKDDLSGLELGLKVVQVLEAAAGQRAKSDAD